MNNLRLSDARVRITSSKIEMIANDLANMYPQEDACGCDLSDQAIELLYNRTRALRQVDGVDREVFAAIKLFVDNFNSDNFMRENDLVK